MKILVVSDTHGMNGNLARAFDRVRPIDMLIHLGDSICNIDLIKEIVDCQIRIVSGNGDVYFKYPDEDVFNIGRYKVFITHGHRHSVYMHLDTIKRAARKRGADILMFGHTHKPMVEYDDGLYVVNPGSLTIPRQDGRRFSFVVMEIDNGGEAHFTICYI